MESSGKQTKEISNTLLKTIALFTMQSIVLGPTLLSAKHIDQIVFTRLFSSRLFGFSKRIPILEPM